MSFRRSLQIIIPVLLLCAYVGVYWQVKAFRADMPKVTKRAEALAVDPTLLRVISGPFKGVMADFLLLKASIFVGGTFEALPEDWETVYTLFKQSLYLDPNFFSTGYYTQGLLAWREGQHERAVELLKYHAEHRYWDWEPMFYLGFDLFYYLNNDAEAAHYMQLAAERPGAPPIAATLAARLAQKGGKTLTAIALLKEMYDRAEDERFKARYAKKIKAHVGVYELEQAIDHFERQTGRKPHSLPEIVESGTLKRLPENPYGFPYEYDPETGKITFREYAEE